MKFKLGDLVICDSNSAMDDACKNKIGRIIETQLEYKHWYCVEFFNPIEGGHSGDGKGKNGYCWNLINERLELYKEPILKTFLKEKESTLL